MNTLFGGFRYEGLGNLGDNIQSISAEMHLPRVDKRFNRDTLLKEPAEGKYITIMNGWFSHQPQFFPPAASIQPVFWGFHITNWNDSWKYFLSKDVVNYLKSHEPIGCRDKYTMDKLMEAGVNAFYSKCLTLTLPRRNKPKRNGWNILVDVPTLLPPFIEDNAIHVTHEISAESTEKCKMEQAKKLLDLYRNNARLIITTRLHCALPAVAMGIPVIFLGNPTDYRLSIIKDIGLEINNYPKNMSWSTKEQVMSELNTFWESINWDPRPIDYEKEKTEMIANFKKFFNSKIPS